MVYPKGDDSKYSRGSGQILTMGQAMALEQQNEKSLHNRVNDYLSRTPVTYGVVESEEETIESILDELNKAGEELRAVKERIQRLKWALAKAKS